MTRLQTRESVTEAIDERQDSADERREFLYGWINTRTAMRHLGVTSINAVYRLIEEQRLPYGRVGRAYRFRRIDLDHWAARTASHGTPRAVGVGVGVAATSGGKR